VVFSEEKNRGSLLDGLSVIVSSCDTVVLTDIFCSPASFRDKIIVDIIGSCLTSTSRCSGLEFASCFHLSTEDEFPQTLCTVSSET